MINTEYLDSLIEKDKAKGLFRCKREMFTSKELFELEMEHIFEGNWIYLAHESQLPKINDYYTTKIGRQPVFITRNKDNQLNCFINACAHRGATLARFKHGNKGSFTCPFHGWTFNNSGKLLKIKDPSETGYPESFNCNGSHDLKKIARFASYRGFLFGSLNPDVQSLEDFLGESKVIIDMIVDQSPEGLEVLRGSSTYVYEGNWKLQAENGADGYHVTATHWNYAATQAQRKSRDAGDDIKAMSAGGWAKKGGGSYSFENGHLLLWTRWDNPEDRPLMEQRERLVAEFGEAKADWMIGNSRNLCLYPNVPDGPVQLADPRIPPARRQSHRSHDLLHRPQGRIGRGPRPPHPPVRGLLQRLGHGHAGRPRRVPRLPGRLHGPRAGMERHVPRCRSLGRRPGRGSRQDRPQAHPFGREDRGRRPLRRPAQLLAR